MVEIEEVINKKEKEELITGLSDVEVKERREKGLVNYDTTTPTKTIKRILFENFFTLFNIINLFLGICVFLAGSYKNMIFLAIVTINTAISTFQEINAKRTIDKLSVMATSKAKVLRDGKFYEISINDLVLDDVIELSTGNQVATDCIVLNGEVQVNESFITGEPDTIIKKAGDRILSGSFIVSDKCLAKVEHIGDDNYTAKISSGAKYIKKVKSEIMSSLNKIIRFLTILIIPIGIALFFMQYQVLGLDYKEAVVKTVAGIIGMIPEGLVLLTSTVLAVSVIRLSKSKVLVQELYCIETLARVDTLCLDKTGTLTEGIMEVKDFIPLTKTENEMKNILANISKFSEDENSTITAIREYFKDIDKEFIPNNKIAFSSKSKWSGINFEEEGSYIIGAPEIILKSNFEEYEPIINKYTKDYRVIALAHSNENFKDNNLPNNIEIIGLVLILDKLRKEASSTLEYFYKQDVDIKIISGDNPVTVSKIAKQVGVKNYDNYIDMSKVKDEEIDEIVLNYSIFGRVSPVLKQLLVKALKRKKRTVAMTGDGVNDVLALKESDCSIAMANGSDAAKNISQLVLLDSNFASMPKVVAEGRRTINNLQRSASLFLVKTIYSAILAVMFLCMGTSYPFIPIQLSLISTVTIGIPSFLLALEPNKERIKGKFLQNVIIRSLPTSLAVAINIFIISMLHKIGYIPQEQYSSYCVISTGMCGIILLFTLAKKRKTEEGSLPVSVFRLVLAILLTGLFIFGLTYLNWWFNIAPLVPMLNGIFRILLVSLINFVTCTIILRKIFDYINTTR